MSNSALAEYLPLEAETTADAGVIKWTQSVEATQAIFFDQELSQGAKLLGVAIIEFSFIPTCGGDRRGRLTASVDFLAHWLKADPHSIIKWQGQLAKRGHIWIDKIKVPSGWPRNCYCISRFVPRSDQRDLLPTAPKGTNLVLSHTFGTIATVRPPVVPGNNAPVVPRHNAPVVKSNNAPVVESNNAPVVKRHNAPVAYKHNPLVQGTRVPGYQRPNPSKNGPLGREYEIPKFEDLPEGIFESRIAEMIKDVDGQIWKIQHAPPGPFKSNIFASKNYAWLQSEAKRLKKTDPKKAKEFLRRAEDLKADPDNWTTGPTELALLHLDAWKKRKAYLQAKLYRRPEAVTP